MFGAHVQFELERWSDEGLRIALADEISALYTWLADIKLNEIAHRAEVLAAFRRALVDLPVSDGLMELIEEGVKTVFAALCEDGGTVGELLGRRQYDQMTETLVGMKPLRREVTRQIVGSSVYAMLVSNVLYNGIKSYVLTENVFARRIPGASSLVRFGQSALNSAVPNLEKGVDRQLIAFIHANIRETLNESERYLNTVLDDPMIWRLADELWESNSQRTMAEVTDLVNPAVLADMVDSWKNLFLHLRTTRTFDALLESVLDGFLANHGDKFVADLLADVGIEPEELVETLFSAAQPLVARARIDGYLEARIRSRLEAFYGQYLRS